MTNVRLCPNYGGDPVCTLGLGSCRDGCILNLSDRITRQAIQSATDERHMLSAINLAKLALWEGRAGYGCVIVDAAGAFLGAGRGSETPTDCTCHSEVVAIHEAMERRGGLLHGATLYSTFEPCMLCCGAICHSKVSRVVWGAERADLAHIYRRRNLSAHDLLRDTSEPPELRAGVLHAECVTVTAAAPRPSGAIGSVNDTTLALF